MCFAVSPLPYHTPRYHLNSHAPPIHTHPDQAMRGEEPEAVSALRNMMWAMTMVPTCWAAAVTGAARASAAAVAVTERRKVAERSDRDDIGESTG